MNPIFVNCLLMSIIALKNSEMECKTKMLVQMLVILLGICSKTSQGNQLAYNYYETSCPQVENIVRIEMSKIFASDSTATAVLLRLLFHDCQVQGCDASILLETGDSEIHSSKNFGIGKFAEIARVKSSLEGACPGQVSCADIIALAAREAVLQSGGPSIQIPLGRKDSMTSNSMDADTRLPSQGINVDQLLPIFSAMGMNLEESVAILGAHTLGVGHCVNIANRIFNPTSTDMINPVFRLQLQLTCPTPVPFTNIAIVQNDATPTTFDNQYYKGVLMGTGLFAIDSSISSDPRTTNIASQFAADQDHFFSVFSSAFVKLSSANVLTGNMGEVRLQCNKVN